MHASCTTAQRAIVPRNGHASAAVARISSSHARPLYARWECLPMLSSIDNSRSTFRGPRCGPRRGCVASPRVRRARGDAVPGLLHAGRLCPRARVVHARRSVCSRVANVSPTSSRHSPLWERFRPQASHALTRTRRRLRVRIPPNGRCVVKSVSAPADSRRACVRRAPCERAPQYGDSPAAVDGVAAASPVDLARTGRVHWRGGRRVAPSRRERIRWERASRSTRRDRRRRLRGAFALRRRRLARGRASSASSPGCA